MEPFLQVTYHFPYSLGALWPSLHFIIGSIKSSMAVIIDLLLLHFSVQLVDKVTNQNDNYSKVIIDRGLYYILRKHHPKKEPEHYCFHGVRNTGHINSRTKIQRQVLRIHNSTNIDGSICSLSDIRIYGKIINWQKVVLLMAVICQVIPTTLVIWCKDKFLKAF